MPINTYPTGGVYKCDYVPFDFESPSSLAIVTTVITKNWSSLTEMITEQMNARKEDIVVLYYTIWEAPYSPSLYYNYSTVHELYDRHPFLVSTGDWRNACYSIPDLEKISRFSGWTRTRSSTGGRDEYVIRVLAPTHHESVFHQIQEL